MRLLVLSHKLGGWTAEYICQQITAFHPACAQPFVLGLPTGGTVEQMYEALCLLYQQGRVNFSNVITFNMDEYVGLSPDDPHSYHYYMKHLFFDRVQLPPSQTFLPNGQADDLEAECRAYEAHLQAAGGVHLFLGGIGRNGHIAFNEPGSSFTSRTRPVRLAETTRRANARFFGGDISRVPTHALSVGIGTVLEAREILFLASGPEKAEAVFQAAMGKITPQWPITALRTHPFSTLLIDRQAAEKLPEPLQQEIRRQLSRAPDKPAEILL